LKRNLTFMLLCAAFALLFPTSVFGAEKQVIQVNISNKPIKFNIDPVLVNNRTFVQFRPTFEELGMKVEWDSAGQKVTGTKKGYRIELVIGNKEAIVNGVTIALDAAPFMKSGVTMVPLRFISEATGRFVNWNRAGKLINIVETDLSVFTDLFYSDAFTYLGPKANGLKEGNGRLLYSDGTAFYEGGFVQDKLQGTGKYFDRNGYVLYEGEWKNNLMDGKGKWYYGDGRLKYEGQFKAGKKEGQGTLVWRQTDGIASPTAQDLSGNANKDNTYTGAFKNDKFWGQGTLVWADGASYKGSFADGMISGSGELVWADGWKYVGQFVNGVRQGGSGELYNANGKLIYTGAFKNNTYEGQGELFDDSGKSVYKGIFINGKPKT